MTAENYYQLFQSAIGAPERPVHVILFADIVGSTDMKSKMGEVAWLPTIGKFYDVVTSCVEKHGGKVSKYLGDGVIGVFKDDAAQDAINSAIEIQEHLEELRTSNQVPCQCSIGITTGSPVEFEGPGGAVDYIGRPVDLAARICGAAAANAIWADPNTVHAANLGRIKARLGVAMRRQAADYITQEESITLRGIGLQKYYEVIWSSSAFGVRSSAVTNMVETQTHGSPPIIGTAPNERNTVKDGKKKDDRNWKIGEICSWNPEKGSGYISVEDSDVDHYFIKYVLLEDTSVKRGTRVAFLPRPPRTEGKNPTAACVVPLSTPIEGQVEAFFPHKGYAFIRLVDMNRNQGIVFYPCAANEELVRQETMHLTLEPDRSGLVARRAVHQN